MSGTSRLRGRRTQKQSESSQGSEEKRRPQPLAYTPRADYRVKSRSERSESGACRAISLLRVQRTLPRGHRTFPRPSALRSATFRSVLATRDPVRLCWQERPRIPLIKLKLSPSQTVVKPWLARSRPRPWLPRSSVKTQDRGFDHVA